MRRILIGLLAGDGIGPEVMQAAWQVVQAVSERAGFQVELTTGLIGERALEETGQALPRETIQLCRAVDGVLLGPVGGAHWTHATSLSKPKYAILQLYGWLGIFANLRPVLVLPGLVEVSPLKPEVAQGIDLLVIRDISSGLYYGRPRGASCKAGQRVAFNASTYSEGEIERVARVAFEAATRRRGELVLADQGKLLETGLLWRETCEAVAVDYPGVHFRSLDADQCVLELTMRPRAFDVLLADIIVGDLLAAQAASLCGSPGLHASAALGHQTALFSPGHGSAPDLEGQDRANPIAAMLAAAMLLETRLGLGDAAQILRVAIHQVLASGIRTFDVCLPGQRPVGTRAFTEHVVAAVSGVKRCSGDDH